MPLDTQCLPPVKVFDFPDLANISTFLNGHKAGMIHELPIRLYCSGKETFIIDTLMPLSYSECTTINGYFLQILRKTQMEGHISMCPFIPNVFLWIISSSSLTLQKIFHFRMDMSVYAV